MSYSYILVCTILLSYIYVCYSIWGNITTHFTIMNYKIGTTFAIYSSYTDTHAEQEVHVWNNDNNETER